MLDSRWLRVVARVLAVVLTVWTLAALVLGPDSARNPVPHVVYVWLWVGLAFSSMLLGPVWRVINPLRALHAGLLRLARVSPDLAALPYRWGLWPAALGLGTFTWVELVAEENTSLGFLRFLVAGFFAVSLLGARRLRPHVVRPRRPLRGVVTPARPALAARPAPRRAVGAAHPAARRQRPARPAWARAHGRRHARRHGIRRLLGEPVVGDVRADLARAVVAAADGDPARLLRPRGRDALDGLGGVGAALRRALRPLLLLRQRHRAVAHPDRRGLPRRALLVAVGLPGAVRVAPAERPSRHRRGPARAPPTSPRATCSSSRHSSRRSRP